MNPGTKYPELPGFKEKHGTSEEAARKIAASGRSEILEKRCLQVIQRKPAAMFQVARELGEKPGSIAPRLSQLYKRGEISKLERVRVANPDGNSVCVYCKNGIPDSKQSEQ